MEIHRGNKPQDATLLCTSSQSPFLGWWWTSNGTWTLEDTQKQRNLEKIWKNLTTVSVGFSCVFMNFPNQPRCFGKTTQNPLRKFRIDYLWLVENFAVIQVTLHLTCPILTSNPKSPTVPWHMDFKSAPPPRPFKIPALKLCSLSPGAALRNALPQCLERHCRANYSELFIATQVLRSSFCMFPLTLGLGNLPWIHLTQSCLHGKYCSIAKQKEGDPKCKPTMACLVAPPAPQGLEESLGQCPARQP